MNAEQKKRIAHEISNWKNACNCRAVQLTGDRMAALLQELIDAPETEPVARVTGYYAGYLSIETIDGRVLPAGTAVYTSPPAPSAPDGWKHDCAGIMQNDVELWLDSCPHCGKPKTDAAPTPAAPPVDLVRDVRLQVESEFAALLPGVTYMDEPDGGSPTVQEQIARMAMDAERYWWLTQDHPASEIRKLVDEIGYCLSVRGYGATSAAIDAARERQGGE